MSKLKNVVVALTMTTLCGAALLTLEPRAKAGDACQNVHFKYVNERSTTIKVKSVEFYNKNAGKWRTEDVVNEECAPNATCSTNGDNLADAEGDDITKVKFNYVYKEADGDWSDLFHGGEKTVSGSTECNANRTYGTFDITG